MKKLKEFIAEAIALGIQKAHIEDYIERGLTKFVGDPSSALYNAGRLVREQAQESSAKYIADNMQGAMLFFSPVYELNRFRLLKHALEAVSLEGLFCEFGVFSGKSINEMAALVPDRRIYGFDSFEGLPEDWSGWAVKAGYFKCELPKVETNVTLIKGYFDATLPVFVKETPGRAAFLHVDCDLYSSTKTILRELKTRIVSGTVILFDEYFNYPNWQEHEYRAFQEFILEADLRYQYIGSAYHQVAIKIL